MLIVLSGGGTAGHINPALALADVLKQRGCEVRFAGTPTGVEARLVREAGIPFTPFEAQGFNRNHPLTLPKAVLTIQKSTTLARRWFDEIRPDAVVGFGGFGVPAAEDAEPFIDDDGRLPEVALLIVGGYGKVHGIEKRLRLVLNTLEALG